MRGRTIFLVQLHPRERPVCSASANNIASRAASLYWENGLAAATRKRCGWGGLHQRVYHVQPHEVPSSVAHGGRTVYCSSEMATSVRCLVIAARRVRVSMGWRRINHEFQEGIGRVWGKKLHESFCRAQSKHSSRSSSQGAFAHSFMMESVCSGWCGGREGGWGRDRTVDHLGRDTSPRTHLLIIYEAYNSQ